MHQRLFQLSAIVGALVIGGCSGGPPTEELTEKLQPVLGGTASERSTVVYVRNTGGNLPTGCTGTLIAPNLVVTARHCVSSFTNGTYSCTIDGGLDLSRPRSPANAGDMGLAYPPENIAVHTGLRPDTSTPDAAVHMILTPETDTICRNDLAFLILEKDIDAPVTSLRLEAGVVVREAVTVVGYGTNDVRITERTERSGLAVLAVGPSEFQPIEGNALPRTFVIGPSVCPGDSGGPALSEERGDLIGVFSFFRGDCASSEARNFFTEVGPFHDLAREAFEQAGHSELINAPPAGIGGGGGGEPNTPDGGADSSASRNSSGSNDGCTYRAEGSPSPTFAPFTAVLLFGLGSFFTRRRRGSLKCKNSTFFW